MTTHRTVEAPEITRNDVVTRKMGEKTSTMAGHLTEIALPRHRTKDE